MKTYIGVIRDLEFAKVRERLGQVCELIERQVQARQVHEVPDIGVHLFETVVCYEQMLQ